MKKIIILALLVTTVLTGCSGGEKKKENRKNIEFTVVPRVDIPQELLTTLENQKTEEFSMSFGTGDFLYIATGYGKMPTGGYSIIVDEVSETDKEVFFHTTLRGPAASEPVNKMESYPYIVVKIEYTDKKIVFE